MSGALVQVRGIEEISKALEAAPKALVAQTFLEALSSAIEPIYNELLARTPEQEDGESGGMFDEPGSLKYALDSMVELDSQFRGGRAAVGYGKQSKIANLVEYGHEMLTHKKKRIGRVKPHPFMRPTFDGQAPVTAIDRFATVMAEKLPSVKL